MQRHKASQHERPGRRIWEKTTVIQLFTTTACALRKPVALATLAVGLLVGTSAWAASDYLLELGDVKGESKNGDHRETIEIASFGWGANSTMQTCEGRMGRGETIVTGAAATSNARLVAVARSGKVIPRATLFGRKAGSGSATEIKLEDVMISSVAAPNGRRTGAVKLSFASASWSSQGCKIS